MHESHEKCSVNKRFSKVKSNIWYKAPQKVTKQQSKRATGRPKCEIVLWKGLHVFASSGMCWGGVSCARPLQVVSYRIGGTQHWSLMISDLRHDGSVEIINQTHTNTLGSNTVWISWPQYLLCTYDRTQIVSHQIPTIRVYPRSPLAGRQMILNTENFYLVIFCPRGSGAHFVFLWNAPWSFLRVFKVCTILWYDDERFATAWWRRTRACKCGASSVYPWLLQAFPEFTPPLPTYLYPMQSIRTGWFVLRNEKVYMKTCCRPRFRADFNFESKFAALYFRNRICGLETLFSCQRKMEFICFQPNSEVNSPNKT